jgi:hypothetical protein
MCVCVCVCLCVYTYAKLHVNGKRTINTGSTEVAPPSFDSSGGIGDRTIFWIGTPTSVVMGC